ncbi:hypothetical protein ARMGADRAFT_1171076 [Armillaria gallica]|uniref:F-box domain-containing protein n=1 Tax=Armillaria gallica TaxID=47427 RepID=A0A2H3D1P4_ARMGA|nr:hypothetical protein ARMGADRAFT_1171076 [Armillaria gallica]
MTTAFKNRAPSDSTLSVPQELIDYILDFLHDDIPTLRTCSLVSHSFLPCTRYHIYSSVTIVHVDELDLFRERYAGQLYRSQNLAALLEHSSCVAPLITRLGMRSMAESMMEDAIDTSLVSIISSLHNLSHIELIAHQSENFPVVTLTPFLAALRSVPLKTFIFCAITLETQEQFEDLFTAVANPALKHLSLVCDCGPDWSPGPYLPVRPPPDGLPALESLCIAGCRTSDNISWLFFKQSLYDFRGIRHLSLQLSDNAASPLVRRLLNAMQGTLESLTLDIEAFTNRSPSSSTSALSHTLPYKVPHLDLSGHRNLSSFFIIMASSLDPRLLTVAFNPMLQTLTVEQLCSNWQRDSRRSVSAWAEFDKHLDRQALLALQRVHVRLHDSVHVGCYWFVCDGCEFPTDHERWKRQVEDAMPLLKGRNILEVEVVKQRYCIPRALD